MSEFISDTSAQKHMLSTSKAPFIYCKSTLSISLDIQAILELSSISSLLSFSFLRTAFAVVPVEIYLTTITNHKIGC